VLASRNFNLRQFARFSVVGVLQNGTNLAVFAIVIAAGVPYLLASLLAAAVALTLSFFLNLRWTFPGRSSRMRARVVRFVTIWVTIVLLGLPLLAALVSLGHVPRIIAQAIVIAVGAPVSYMAQRRWTFAHALR
jgi:putative flippase GtrA